MKGLDPDRTRHAAPPLVEEDPAAADAGVARALASSPIVWRGAVAAIGCVALLTARAGITGLFDEIVGLTMIAIAVLEHAPRVLGGEGARWWRSAVLVLAGVLIFLWPSETAQSAGTLAAVAIAAYGVTKSVQAVTSAARDRRRDRLARGVLTVALATVVILFPEATVRVVVIAIGALWALEAALVASAIGRSGADGAEPFEPTAPHERLGRYLARRQMSEVDRRRVDAALFLDGEDGRRRLFRFAVLMGLSTTIATFGIAADSTAVVIGAMLIAPLMTPILATASAALQGWTARALRSAAIVVVASGGAVALAWVLAALVPNVSSVVTNAQVASRTAPSLLDLGIAVAAGAAGAFAVNRADVSEALPGVAVAIALVPPLSVVGLTAYTGNFEQALGAALLFVTNLIAIVAMASIVFVLTGYVTWAGLLHDRRRLRVSYITVAASIVVLLIPLGLTTRRLIIDAAELRVSRQAVDRWLAHVEGINVSHLAVDHEVVEVTVQGPGDPPSADALHAALADVLDRDVVLELRVVPEVLHVVGGDGR